MQSKTPKIVKLMEKLRQYEGKDRMVHFEELMESEKDKLKPKTYYTKIFPKFDFYSSGIQEGEQVIIGGASNEGKTLLTLSLISAFEKQGYISAFFSFEQTVEQIAEKYNYLPPIFYVPASVDYETKYDSEVEKLKNDRSTYLGTLPSAQLKWIYLKLLEMQAKGIKPQAVFIDYLHVLMGRGYDSAVWALGDVMIQLKQIALQMRLMIFIVCHTRKEAMEKSEPGLADLRDSGWIVNCPDIIFLLWRKMNIAGDPSDISVLKIAKHRRKGNAKNIKVELTMDSKNLLVEHSPEELYNVAE